MRGILFDVVVVVFLAFLTAQIGGWALGRTSLGVRWRQSRNRRLLERERPRHCPRHGEFAEQDLVRLPSGETLCPKCYEEIYHADLD
jgi:hypothetical protein